MSQGVDPAAVAAFVDAADTDPAIELHGVMVLRHGHVVAEGWWAPGREQGFSGLFARTEDITKLGRLYLQHGRWGGQCSGSRGRIAAHCTRTCSLPDQRANE